MTDSFSKQHRAFITAYCLHFNATNAAKDAKYKCNSDDAFATQGLRLLRNVQIKDEVNRLCAEQDEATLATKAFVVNKIKEVLEADIVDYVALGAEGATEKQIAEMPKSIRKMVTSIERIDFYGKDDTGRAYTTHSRYKFKLICKTKMMELIAKHTGAVKEGPLAEITNINQMSYGNLLEQFEKKP